MSREKRFIRNLRENQFLILRSDQSEKKSQLGRVEGEMIRKLVYRKSRAIWHPSEKCRTVFFPGSTDAAGGESTACDRKRDGGNQ